MPRATAAHHVKDYFLDYRETESNDFVLRKGEVELQGSDIADWTIHFVHTGLESPIGERLRRVRHLVEDEEMFLANYADVLTDAPLDDMIETFRGSDAAASLLAVPPQAVFHIVDVDPSDRVNSIYPVTDMRIRENGGYFALRPEVIDYIPENGDLVGDACTRLAKEGTPARRTPTTASGSPPTPSRSATPSRRPTAPARARGWSGRREPERTPLEGLVRRAPVGPR